MEAKFKFTGLDVGAPGARISARFELMIGDEVLGGMQIEVAPKGHGTTDGMIATAHREMSAIARKWAAAFDESAVFYETKAAG